jgi:anti-sigma factor (TIGR02949 family)
MQCDEVGPRLEAYVDGELAEVERGQLRDHLAGCPECGPEAMALERLRDGIRRSAPIYCAPEALRSRLRFALRREAAATARAARPAPGWLAYAASIMLAVALGSGGTWLMTGERQESRIGEELIDSHLRSLLADHLTDVASSDKHTVKPWFAGRTDVAPPGVDLAAQGFPLIGGRLDLIQGQHVINVFVLPARPNELNEAVGRRGYTLRHWNGADLSYWAVSDASPDEFSKFEHAFRAATSG